MDAIGSIGSPDSGSPTQLESFDSQGKVKKKFRRNRVACDACHTRRVRCDGSFPCSRCVGSRINCELTRERRKRGRIASKKALDSINAIASSAVEIQQSEIPHPSRPPQSHSGAAIPSIHAYSSPPVVDDPLQHTQAPVRDRYSFSENRPSPREILGLTASEELPPMSNGLRMPYSYDLLRNQSLQEGPVNPSSDIFANRNGVELESSRSGNTRGRAPSHSMIQEVPLKYPVLQPLMPCLEPHISRALVYDLFELYFTSAFSTSMHPACHHIHCYIMRKASLLSQENPRKTSPALLSSMLWVAALDDRAFALSISPTKRRKVCQFLCALTIRLLHPLIHVSFRGEDPIEGLNEYPSPTAMHDPAANRTHSFEEGGDDRGLVGPAGSLDDIITYIHIASIISASEQKAASMRWWHAAFTLARELKLNQEVEASPTVDNAYESAAQLFDFPGSTTVPPMPIGDTVDYSGPIRHSLNCLCDRPQRQQDVLTEEHREERRRTWWLLYIMDRHLALCYNRPLALLDAECEDLLLPLEEGPWQAGDVHSNSPKPDGPRCLISGAKHKRRTFPDFACHDHSIFGFFLPLMMITGELININLAKNHPMLGTKLEGKNQGASQIKEVFQQLDVYKSTLATFTASSASNTVAHLPDVIPYPSDSLIPSPSAISPPILPPSSPTTNLSTYHSWHTQTVVAYASYLVHVLHILLTGKWDPVSLLEDKDFWTSSPTFASTISHALEAANALEQILHYDPDISFMPYFFGIQLLQGSILLLLIVERLQNEAGEGILKACEVVIRATESCVVTLNTEYQRMFRQVMRSAVAQARGRPVNHSEIRHRRKAVLALYRWTRNGTGLAL